MSSSGQIFQTNKPTRWQRFKWGSRFILFLFLLAFAIVVIAVKTLYKPDITIASQVGKKVFTDSLPDYMESGSLKKYKGFRHFIQQKNATFHKQQGPQTQQASTFNDIRAAFYVTWNPESYNSLQRNISKLNLVLPEWFFIDATADTLTTNIDAKGLQFMQSSGIKIMPVLTNAFNGSFNGAAIHRILNNENKKQKLINDVVKNLQRYKFSGVNIDFEELTEKGDEQLIAFQKQLYETLHAQGFTVTQDIIPFNNDYNFTALQSYNDYLILMAYDEHSTNSKPGPIASQQWIEAAVDNVAKKVSADKIILGMPSYGYDWNINGKGSSISYQEALALARDNEEKPAFDNNTYNLNLKYYDEDKDLHTVYFTDAATTFNTMRFASEYNLAGTALWRLGSEDERMWQFYNTGMKSSDINSFNFNNLQINIAATFPDYIGEGEILDVKSTPTQGQITIDIDSTDLLISEEKYDKLPASYVINRYGKTSQKKLVLTFDDGPNPIYTKQILDTLAYYHAPAAFFIVGLEGENNIDLVQRIYREGHEIGNHTFTHPNIADVSTNRALLEMDLTRLLIEATTGHSTIMFRAPFNADSEPGKYEELVPVALSRTRNYLTVGESLDPEDWQKAEQPNLNADTILNRIINIYNYRVSELKDSANIILLHDAGGDRSETVLATGKIIRYFRARGYTFTTVGDLIGKSRDELMPAVPDSKVLETTKFIMQAGYIVSHILFALFIAFLILSGIRLLIIAILALKRRNKVRHLAPVNITSFPLVSIIVPAYNEEVNVIASLNNLLQCTYPNFNIIFIDDGSKDNTYANVLAAFGNNTKMRILTKANGGKASALNYGIAQTNAPYVVCIDADTRLKPDAVALLMQSMLSAANENVGAVAGNVKVGNEVNMITRWQSIEYITGQSFDRKAFAQINAITVVPGAIGAFSKKALDDAGGFTTDTLAEDCDLTIRILKAGYVITEEPRAIALTEAPETIKQFMKQRFRWSFGVMQTFWKHRDAFFSTKYKSLGWIALPDMLLFKYIIPLFAPLADVMMMIGLLTGSAEKIGLYYLVFMLVDAAIAALAFGFEKEDYKKLIWLIPQRLVYRWLMLVVLFRSLRRAVKGELQHWGVLKRTGNVKESVA